MFFKESPKSLSSCKPHHPGLGTGVHGGNSAAQEKARKKQSSSALGAYEIHETDVLLLGKHFFLAFFIAGLAMNNLRTVQLLCSVVGV